MESILCFTKCIIFALCCFTKGFFFTLKRMLLWCVIKIYYCMVQNICRFCGFSFNHKCLVHKCSDKDICDHILENLPFKHNNQISVF